MKELWRINQVVVLLILLGSTVYGQNEIGKSFYDTRIVNGHSTQMNNEGMMKFIISHRFGRINSGAYELFGLDQSTIRVGMDYGIKEWLSVGIGRSTNEKTVDGFLKFRLIQQKSGKSSIPISVVGFSNLAINGLRWQDTTRVNYFTSRMFYSFQLLISRKFSDRVSAQLMPSLVHRNLIPTSDVNHDVFAIGAAFRYKILKRLTMNAEYYFVLPDQISLDRTNSLALGFEIETKGHVFQLHFGNSRGMTEKFFISETSGDWLEGDIHFGFNISRDFKVKGKKY